MLQKIQSDAANGALGKLESNAGSPRARLTGARGPLDEEERGDSGRAQHGGGTSIGSERLREALVGYAFVALPMAFFSLALHLPDRLRDLHQPLRLGRPREVEHVGLGELPRPRPRRALRDRALKNTL